MPWEPMTDLEEDLRPTRHLGGPPRFRAFGDRQLAEIPQLAELAPGHVEDMQVVASVLPFRVSEYVLSELIDWTRVPNDPLFQLTFPQPGMLAPEHFEEMAVLHKSGASPEDRKTAAAAIRAELNPHPAGQREHNVPLWKGEPLNGIQHKYRETVLVFPSQGQTCHSYCTFCFRWAQFVHQSELKMAAVDMESVRSYLADHEAVSDILITGGDPMVMKTRVLEQYLRPLLAPEFDHIQTIRIGTKALTFWPRRFTSDPDAGDLLALLRSLVAAGKHVALMAHFDHWRELDTPSCRDAVRALREAGVVLRSQAPLLRHVNDDPEVWAKMWRMQVRMGIIPYYMFVERDTGARRYFEVPLARAHEIYTQAIRKVSGLARTVRGPSMSCGPGKIEITGISEIAGEKVFALRFLQARNPEWVGRPFYAQFDAQATWLDDLRPAFGEEAFFFEAEYAEILTPIDPELHLQ